MGTRDYKKEYRDYQGTPEQIAKRSQRNKARREFIDAHGAAAAKGKDIDHIDPIRSGGGNGIKNLRAISPARNRGWRDGV